MISTETIGMGDSKRVKKSINLKTVGLGGCTVCVLNGEKDNFIAHVNSHCSLKMAKQNIDLWETEAKTIGAHKLTIYMGLFMDVGEIPTTHEETHFINQFVTMPLEFKYYNIDDPISNGMISILNDNVSEINSLLHF